LLRCWGWSEQLSVQLLLRWGLSEQLSVQLLLCWGWSEQLSVLSRAWLAVRAYQPLLGFLPFTV
jgi:hypothetical protein